MLSSWNQMPCTCSVRASSSGLSSEAAALAAQHRLQLGLPLPYQAEQQAGEKLDDFVGVCRRAGGRRIGRLGEPTAEKGSSSVWVTRRDRAAARREEEPQIFERSHAHGHPGLVGGAAEVGQEHHVLHGEQRGRDLRLALVDVEAGPGDRARPQRLHQRRLVYHVTPRGVDEKGAPPHPGQPLAVHEVAGLRRGRTVERDEVRLLQHLLRACSRGSAPSAARFRGRGRIRIVKDHPHAESVWARLATARAIRPMPISPSVFPLT